jgi:hypothetical protein
MLAVMAKKPKKSEPSAYTYRPKQDVREALKSYRDAQKFDLPVPAIIDRAVREFLKREGYDIPEKPVDDE